MQVAKAHYWCILKQTEVMPKLPADVVLKTVGSFGDGVWWMTFEVPIWWSDTVLMRRSLEWYGFDVLDMGLQNPYPWFSNAGLIKSSKDSRGIWADFQKWYVHNWHAHRAEILARQKVE